MAWENVGTARKSKAGDHLILVVNKVRYIADIADIGAVISGAQDYAKIAKPPADTPAPNPVGQGA